MDVSDLPPGCDDYVNEFKKTENKPPAGHPFLRGVAENKFEQNIEDHIISLKIQLADGSEGQMICREKRNFTGFFVYLCIPCGATCAGEGTLQSHLQGKKHKSRIGSNISWPLEVYKAHPYYQKTVIILHESDKPQEVIQLEMEKPDPTKEVHSLHPTAADNLIVVESDGIVLGGIAYLQEAADKFQDTLIGLEYLVELRPNENIAYPKYLCTLCDNIANNNRNIFKHLISFIHRSTFIDVHFPKAAKALLEYRYKPENREHVDHYLSELVRAARQLAGPRRVWVARLGQDDLSPAARAALSRRTRGAPHAREHPDLPDTDLSRLVPPSENDPNIGVSKYNFSCPKPMSPSQPAVQAPIRGSPERIATSLESISSINSDEDTCGVHKPSPDRHPTDQAKISKASTPLNPALDGDRTSHGHLSRFADSNRSNENDRNDRIANPSADQRGNQQRSSYWHVKTMKYKEKRDSNPDYRRHKLDLYKSQLEPQYLVLQAELAYHEKNPEKHPLYPDEWKKFWHNRYKEIQSEGKDPAKHDFKPEWVIYWKNHMKELYKLELELKKSGIWSRLGMSGSPPRQSFERSTSKSPEKPGSRPRETHRSRSPHARKSSYSRSSTQHRSSPRAQKRRPFSQNKGPKRDSSSESSDDDDSIKSVSPSGRDPDKDRKDQIKKNKDKKAMQKEKRKRYGYSGPPPEDNDPVSLLRLLSAVENYLGSLGPKIVDLLTLALKMEKTKPNSSEKLFQSEDNAVLLDTVKEKLKGQLQSRLVERTAVGAVRRAVTRVAAMSRLTRNAPRPGSPPQCAAEVLPSADKICGLGSDMDSKDKAAVAAQIAAALVASGKKNVSPQELAKLVEAVVGEAKAAKDKESKTSSLMQNIQMSEKSSKPNNISALQMLQSAYDENSAVKREVSPDAMDGLSDADLQTLLQNFKDLPSEKQCGLIAYLKKLKAKEGERLKQLVSPQALSGEISNKGSAISPLALRSLGGSNTLKDVNAPATSKSLPFDDGDNKTANATITEMDSDDDYTLNDQPPQPKEPPPTPASAVEDPTAAILRLVQCSTGQNLLSMLSMNSANSGVLSQGVPLEQQLLLAQQLGLGGQLQQQLNLQQPLLDAVTLGDHPMGQPMRQPMGQSSGQQDYQRREYRQDGGQYYSKYEAEERYKKSGDDEDYGGRSGNRGARGRGGYDRGYRERGGGYNQSSTRGSGYGQTQASGRRDAWGGRGNRGRGEPRGGGRRH